MTKNPSVSVKSLCDGCAKIEGCLDAGVPLPRKGNRVRAFATTLDGVKSIVFADEPSKARNVTFLSARDAGYSPTFTEISVSRAKSFDGQMTCDCKPALANFCYAPEYLKES